MTRHSKTLDEMPLFCPPEQQDFAKKAIEFLKPSVTTYERKAGQSTLISLKKKERTLLQVEPNLRIKLKIFPTNLKFLIFVKLLQTSN